MSVQIVSFSRLKSLYMSLYPRYLIHWLTHCCCSNIYLVNISSYYMDNHDFIELGWIWLQWIEAHCCSVTNLCPTLCDSMDGSTPGFLVLHCLLEYAQTHVHWVSDVIQPSHPLLPPSPLANLRLVMHLVFGKYMNIRDWGNIAVTSRTLFQPLICWFRDAYPFRSFISPSFSYLLIHLYWIHWVPIIYHIPY